MIGVLVMAYGTPATPADVEAYYTRIRHGHAPTPELLADLQRRYDAIGGTSPLAERTDEQVAGVAAGLGVEHPGGYRVLLGTKYTEPSIEDAAAALANLGAEKVVGLVLTPHFSTMGTGQYHERAAAALEGGPAYLPVERWWGEKAFVTLMAERVDEALRQVPADLARSTVVIFTAHSLPQRVLEAGDPYPDEVAGSADAVAAKVGLTSHLVAWQSAGRTRDPWIGPDILDVLREQAAAGTKAVVICPIGFISDHLEVLYDVDIEAKALADELGLTLVRTRSLNADTTFTAMLADVVHRRAQRAR